MQQRVEVGDVFREHGPSYLASHQARVSHEQRYVLRQLTQCRTASLGGHVLECSGCGKRQIAYNSCRNRHCPKCQGSARHTWLQAREAELLPVPYFHVVFTMPHPIARLALQNRRVIYGILFQAASQTLLQIAADPKHLGARIGFLAVLHTWGQNLLHHPHVHCVVPAGGLSPNGSQWVPGNPKYLLPVNVLSQVFRCKFMELLRKAFSQSRLQFHGQFKGLSHRDAFMKWLPSVSFTKDWVVFAKRPFGGPGQTLKYLSRYTHRVAISNGRLLEMQDESIRIRWKDYSDGSQWKTMPLHVHEFIRRFLLHVLPKRFMRIRHYGFLANRNRSSNIERCRRLLSPQTADTQAPGESESSTESLAESHTPCPDCGKAMLIIHEFPAPLKRPHFTVVRSKLPVPYQDTS